MISKNRLLSVMFVFFLLAVMLMGIMYSKGMIKIYNGSGKNIVAHNAKKETNTDSTFIPEQTVSEDDADRKKIKVLISTSDYKSLVHEKIVVSGSKGLIVKNNAGKSEYGKDEKVSFDKSDVEKGDIVIKPLDKGKIKILSLEREYGNPIYRGKIYLRAQQDGFNILNRLSVREYLYSVVSSEMSSQAGLQALRAQAVCARTFAYAHMESTRYKKYNADVDDSISCQVYNNIRENKQTRQAVKDTLGQILTYKGEKANTYYYSTSWGQSATGREVWMNGNIPYMKQRLQTVSAVSGGKKKTDLSSEQAFRKFIKNRDRECFDYDGAWYRWKVSISAKRLESTLDADLRECSSYGSDKILTQDSKGRYVVKPLKNMGDIRQIRVEKREKSGMVSEIVIVGSKNVVKVIGQYNIRKVLDVKDIKIKNREGKVYADMLPSSAFFINESDEKDGKVFVLYGGGSGHGSGMSQRGAMGMEKSGYGYEDILKFYFSSCEVEKIS